MDATPQRNTSVAGLSNYSGQNSLSLFGAIPKSLTELVLTSLFSAVFPLGM